MIVPLTELLHSGIVWNLRVPRALLAFLVGGSLGVAGASLQALVRNPLADPFLLGGSVGLFAVGVLVATALSRQDAAETASAGSGRALAATIALGTGLVWHHTYVSQSADRKLQAE